MYNRRLVTVTLCIRNSSLCKQGNTRCALLLYKKSSAFDKRLRINSSVCKIYIRATHRKIRHDFLMLIQISPSPTSASDTFILCEIQKKHTYTQTAGNSDLFISSASASVKTQNLYQSTLARISCASVSSGSRDENLYNDLAETTIRLQFFFFFVLLTKNKKSKSSTYTVVSCMKIR